MSRRPRSSRSTATLAGLPFAVTARRDDAVIGAAWGWSAGPALELADLAVAPEHRGQGVGRHVLAGVEDLARSRGCTILGATAVTGGATGLLAAAGFRVVDAPDGRPSAAPRRWERHLGAG